MKQIQPVVFPLNLGTATIFNLNSISDNLSTSATFYYQLFTADNKQIQDGNVVMNGVDYTTYSTSPDSNSFAYTWAAGKLGLILV